MSAAPPQIELVVTKLWPPGLRPVLVPRERPLIVCARGRAHAHARGRAGRLGQDDRRRAMARGRGRPPLGVLVLRRSHRQRPGALLDVRDHGRARGGPRFRRRVAVGAAQRSRRRHLRASPSDQRAGRGGLSPRAGHRRLPPDPQSSHSSAGGAAAGSPARRRPGRDLDPGGPAAPAQPLARPRPACRARAADLRFSDEEAGALLERMQLDVEADDVGRLVERTEGWAAGLSLAGLS